MTKFGGVPNIQGAHAVFQLGKPSFKKENLLQNNYCIAFCYMFIFSEYIELVDVLYC